MPTKVNVVLDDDVKAGLDRLVESGRRSRVINAALRREILFDLEMPEEPLREYTAQIFRLMREYHVTCYAAAYHGLAILRGGTMLTADHRYVKRAARAGHLRLLADWHAPTVSGAEGAGT